MTTFEGLVSQLIRKFYILHEEQVHLDKKSISYRELMQFDSVDVNDIKTYLIEQEITCRLYSGSEEWLDFFKKDLQLSFSIIEKYRDNYIEISKRRNLFVHNGGVVNDIPIKPLKSLRFSGFSFREFLQPCFFVS